MSEQNHSFVRKILVTGGAGFIGVNLVRRLLEAGSQVRVLDDLSAGTATNIEAIGTDVEIMEGTISDAVTVSRAAEGTDAIVHLAAQSGVAGSVESPQSDFRINVLGTFNVAQAARGVTSGRVVFASSGAAVGDAPQPLNAKSVPRPTSPYGASKLYGEAILQAYEVFGVHAVSLRFSNVYGPWSSHKSSVIATFVKAALRADPITVYGDGNQVRDFVYVGDIVKAIRRALVSDVSGVVHLGTGRPTSVNELATTLGSVLGVEFYPKHEPSRKGDVRQSFVSTEEASNNLGWRAEVPLDEGLTRTAEWFRSTI